MLITFSETGNIRENQFYITLLEVCKFHFIVKQKRTFKIMSYTGSGLRLVLRAYSRLSSGITPIGALGTLSEVLGIQPKSVPCKARTLSAAPFLQFQKCIILNIYLKFISVVWYHFKMFYCKNKTLFQIQLHFYIALIIKIVELILMKMTPLFILLLILLLILRCFCDTSFSFKR